MRRNDLILIGTLLGTAVVLFLAMFYAQRNTVNGEAVVLIEGKEYGRYPLAEDCEIELPGRLGNNVLLIQNGNARIKSAVCPDKVCMEFGEIHYNTEMIVCRPGGIVILIENGDVQELDAVGR